MLPYQIDMTLTTNKATSQDKTRSVALVRPSQITKHSIQSCFQLHYILLFSAWPCIITKPKSIYEQWSSCNDWPRDHWIETVQLCDKKRKAIGLSLSSDFDLTDLQYPARKSRSMASVLGFTRLEGYAIQSCTISELVTIMVNYSYCMRSRFKRVTRTKCNVQTLFSV